MKIERIAETLCFNFVPSGLSHEKILAQFFAVPMKVVVAPMGNI
jgi:hypothetical protein